MSAMRRLVLLAGIGLLVVTCLFPPWKFVLDLPGTMRTEAPGPYRFVTTPPSVPVTDKGSDLFNGAIRRVWTVQIDTTRHVTGLGGVLAICGICAVLMIPTARRETVGEMNQRITPWKWLDSIPLWRWLVSIPDLRGKVAALVFLVSWILLLLFVVLGGEYFRRQ